MVKILNTFQIKEWDSFTIKNEPISSIVLMERACQAFVHWFQEKFDSDKAVGVFCGTGNNGGDGLGIARLLSIQGYLVSVWIIKGGAPESQDFITNRNRLPEKIKCLEISNKPEAEIFSECSILIDGIFGSGLSRSLTGTYADVVQVINNGKAKIVAIDIPSGLFADNHSNGLTIQADYTITFQAPKLAFLLPENEDRVGQWQIVDIGLSKHFLKEVNAYNYLIDKKFIKQIFPTRKKFAHKGDFGKALLIAGSLGKMGACVLAAKAAVKSGVGLLTTHVPKCGYEIIQISVPEAMASVDPNDNYFSTYSNVEEFTAIGVGPGIGQNKVTSDALKKLLSEISVPMVIDADAINIIASDSSLQHLLPANSILTPHLGELKRLLGNWDNDFDRLEKAKTFSSQTKSILVIKGAYTAIVSPDGRVFFNPTGNQGMAKGGSGDVLTGMLTALLAQKINPLDAAIIGVFIHGFAGDLAAKKAGYTSLTATNIINALPRAFVGIS